MRLSHWLTQWLAKHPFSGPVLSADVMAQQLMEKRGRHHDLRRTFRQAFYGFCVIMMEKHVVISGSVILQTGCRVLVDQAIFTPIFLAVYFLYHGICEGLSRPSMKAKFKQSYASALLANYKVWPLVQAINFYLIPLNFRLIFVNVIALGWSAYLSHLNAKYISV